MPTLIRRFHINGETNDGMPYDLIIKNGRLVKTAGVFKGDLLVAEGKVVGISTSIQNVDAKHIIDAEDLFILPGVIDPHVHLGSYSDQDFSADLRSETSAAVVGGVTTLICFLKAEGSYLNFAKICIEQVERNSLIDIAFHLILLDEIQIEEIPVYVKELGITSFKFFRAPRGDTVSTIQGIDDGLLYRAFQKISKEEGCLAILHAEDLEIIREVSEKLREEGRQDVQAWSESRPPVCEEMSVCSGIILARHMRIPLCIAHLSAANSLDYIAESKTKGFPLFVETCPHYLFLTKDSPFERGPLGKVNPPLRDSNDRDSLWKAIGRGIIDYIGSDHCPYTRESKGKDLWTAKSGLPGISVLLPILLSEGVHKKRIRMEDVARICSYNPSKIFGLWPQKGMIEVGSDADLVLVDLERSVEVRAKYLHSHSDYSPYEGFKIKGWPVITICGGQVVYKDGRTFHDEKKGRYLSRKGSPEIRFKNGESPRS
jgi:D-hydantoinase